MDLFLFTGAFVIACSFFSSLLLCSFGGKGRTGTTIAALLELKKIEQFGVDEIDICGTVSEMRTFRSLLVETVEQYKFIFWVVLALFDSVAKKS